MSHVGWLLQHATALATSRVVSCRVISLSLSLSLFVSFFVSFSSIFLLFLLLLSASLYNTFLFLFTATFLCTKRVPFLSLLPYSWAFLYRFLAFNPFITRRYCISYKPKSKEEREKETEKHSERETHRHRHRHRLSSILWCDYEGENKFFCASVDNECSGPQEFGTASFF